MEIEIHMADGRIVRTTLPAGATITSAQLAVLTAWAVAGKSAEIITE